MDVSTSRRRGQCRMRHTSPLKRVAARMGSTVFCPLHRQIAGQAARPRMIIALICPRPFIAFSRYPMQGGTMWVLLAGP